MEYFKIFINWIIFSVVGVVGQVVADDLIASTFYLISASCLIINVILNIKKYGNNKHNNRKL